MLTLFKKIAAAAVSAAALMAFSAQAVYADNDEFDDTVISYADSRVYGDVTGDNIADIRDIIVFSRHLVVNEEDFGTENIKSIDLNQDGKVDLLDLMIMKKGVLSDSGYPVGSPIYDDEHIVTDGGIKGIDVSKWQGEVDWQTVKDSGIEFVMIKAGEGTEEEVNFRKNIEGAMNAGLKCGVYWFANASDTDEAELEAKACLETISGYSLEYPVAYDFEYRTLENNPAAGNRELMTEMVRTFLLYIQQNGYYPMFYSNLDFLSNYFYADELMQFDLWYARYISQSDNDYCWMWQYSCTGRVDGISVDVDLDTSYKDYSAIIHKYGWNGF